MLERQTVNISKQFGLDVVLTLRLAIQNATRITALAYLLLVGLVIPLALKECLEEWQE